jgi:hypothetical protein
MQNFIERKITKKLETLLKEKQSLVITGMRRVGKTTLLKHLYSKINSENKLFLNLEDALTRKIFSEENYENIKLSLEKQGIDFEKKVFIFIDEIQFIPEISSIIKYFYDEYDIKFVVSGSSSYYIKNHFTESLSGRKFVVELYPLTFTEFLRFKGIEKDIIEGFDQKIEQKSEILTEKYSDLYTEYMRYGGFPDVVLNKKDNIKKEILKDILNSYFQIDVTTLADFQDIARLRDLLILLTQRIGQKINISNISNAMRLNREKIYEYLELLKSTYVINTISQKSSIDNKISSGDKLYFNDIGLANILADISEGAKLENSVYMNLVYDHELTYYQTSSGGEIDFILDEKVGIEVKETPTKHDSANLLKRIKSAKVDKGFLIARNFVDTPKTIMAWDL